MKTLKEFKDEQMQDVEFVKEYSDGITIEIANKIIKYINRAEELGCTSDNNLLKLRDELVDWSKNNEYASMR